MYNCSNCSSKIKLALTQREKRELIFAYRFPILNAYQTYFKLAYFGASTSFCWNLQNDRMKFLSIDGGLVRFDSSGHSKETIYNLR